MYLFLILGVRDWLLYMIPVTPDQGWGRFLVVFMTSARLPILVILEFQFAFCQFHGKS